MIVRDLLPADLPVAAILLDQLGYALGEAEVRKRFERVRRAPDHLARVAEIEGRVVGLLHVFERPALEKPCEAVVQAIVVNARTRGAGVGAALMADAEAWARARGLRSVTLYTNIDRAPAHAFYEGLGYAKTGTSHLMRRGL
ncbi:MAG: GNAT family N-acetyltransferase [Proteobacteria bacterium]|nr:GNAT family N-acetyltransferase [Pseudomonadota bacterium]